MDTPNSHRSVTRVAWVAPFNLRLLRHRLPALLPHVHPAPWITNGIRALHTTGNIELHVVTYAKGLDRDLEFEEDGVWFHILRVRFPAIPRALVLWAMDRPQFRATLRRINPDLVHGHGTENLYALAAVESGYPHIISMQAVMAELAKTARGLGRTALHQSLLGAMERKTLKLASTVLVEAPFVEGLIKRVNPHLQTAVVGNIVSPEFFRTVRDGRRDGRRLLFVGTLVPSKGVEDAIAAFHDVATEWPDAELHLIGTGHPRYQARLRTLAADGPGGDRIRFRGFLAADEIAHEYETAAMLVAPTYYDTSPNVVSESLVAGVPVIAADVGGLPYMLDAGRAGRLVPVRDPTALAGAIDWTLRHPDEAAAAARHGQQLARARYSEQTFVASLLRAYRGVLGVADAVAS